MSENTQEQSSTVVLEKLRIKPADLVIGGPQFAGLVDVYLACLLSVGLAEFLADLESLESCCKYSSLAA